jgi:hypothetical protein
MEAKKKEDGLSCKKKEDKEKFVRLCVCVCVCSIREGSE